MTANNTKDTDDDIPTGSGTDGAGGPGRIITYSIEVSPLTIQIMFACFCSPEPSSWFEPAQWASKAGIEVRHWLLERGLITGDDGIPHGEPRATDRGKAWVSFICATPLPIAHWVLPERPARPATIEALTP